MIQKTSEYDKFVFREDNRAAINQSHVKRIAESILKRNLLEFRPIKVNSDYEVIDGQHRLLAAKSIGVDIYYEVNEELQNDDILIMNMSKSWGIPDYLNYYVKNGFPEYQKLDKFVKDNKIPVRVALNICLGLRSESYEEYKDGRFKFSEDIAGDKIDICWETIDLIKKMNGFSSYVTSSRFWRALLRLVDHPNFEIEKWRSNSKRMVENFCPKADTNGYLKVMSDIYNWRATKKISFSSIYEE